MGSVIEHSVVVPYSHHSGCSHLPKLSCSMPDDFDLNVSFITGVLVILVSLIVSRCLRGDPTVGPFTSYSTCF